jgi:hypothetical protein
VGHQWNEAEATTLGSIGASSIQQLHEHGSGPHHWSNVYQMVSIIEMIHQSILCQASSLGVFYKGEGPPDPMQ